jgi:hypothetical protein
MAKARAQKLGNAQIYRNCGAGRIRHKVESNASCRWVRQACDLAPLPLLDAACTRGIW